MTTLILDTSTDLSLIAIAKGEKLLAEESSSFATKSSSYMPSILDAFFKRQSLSPGDLTEIAVGIGPGSYTGTRVAVTLANALSFALNIPVFGFCSLLAFVPEDVQGSFCFFKEVKRGSPFSLSAFATSNSYQDIHFSSAQKLPIQKDISYIAHTPELVRKNHSTLCDIPIQKASLNLGRLCSFLSHSPESRLSSVELLYLQDLPIEKLSPCSLTC